MPVTLAPPLTAVRLVPGHEEDESLLRRTDLPSFGEVSRLWRSGEKLLCDVDGVPDEFADLVEAGRYDRVSAEFYNPFTYNGESFGPALRRVGVLGAEVPVVKTLADIPLARGGKIKGLEIFA